MSPCLREGKRKKTNIEKVCPFSALSEKNKAIHFGLNIVLPLTFDFMISLDFCGRTFGQLSTACVKWKTESHTRIAANRDQTLSPWLFLTGDIADSGIGMSYRPANLRSLELRIWLQLSTRVYHLSGRELMFRIIWYTIKLLSWDLYTCEYQKRSIS